MKGCATDKEANYLIIHYGERTAEAKVRYVPHIIFNDVVNDTLEEMARENFVEVICDLFTEKPSGC